MLVMHHVAIPTCAPCPTLPPSPTLLAPVGMRYGSRTVADYYRDLAQRQQQQQAGKRQPLAQQAGGGGGGDKKAD